MNELNDKIVPTSEHVYYFSLSFNCVQSFPANWPPWTMEALKSFPLSVSQFIQGLPIISNMTDLLRPVVEPLPFIGGPLMAIPGLLGELAANITQMFINATVDVAGWHIIPNLVPFREVIRWAVDGVLNRFLGSIGYAIKLPAQPEYLPIPNVFPPMAATTYAMACHDLTEHQRNILGPNQDTDTLDWKINDGIVNTASMMGPLNRNGDRYGDRNRELIADASQFPVQVEDMTRLGRGKYWHFGVTSGVDHADEIGVFIDQNTVSLSIMGRIEKGYDNLIRISRLLKRGICTRHLQPSLLGFHMKGCVPGALSDCSENACRDNNVSNLAESSEQGPRWAIKAWNLDFNLFSIHASGFSGQNVILIFVQLQLYKYSNVRMLWDI